MIDHILMPWKNFLEVKEKLTQRFNKRIKQFDKMQKTLISVVTIARNYNLTITITSG